MLFISGFASGILKISLLFYSAEEGAFTSSFFNGYKPDKFPAEILVILAPFFFLLPELGYQTSS